MVFERELRDYPGARVQQSDMMGGGMSQSNLFIGVEEVTRVEKPPEPKGAEAEKRKEVVVPDLPPSDQVDLRELMSNPAPYYDRLISVVGKFRGDNVYNDLPMRTKKTPRDFIIKVADVALWVTGKRPRGKGFELNPERRRDTGKWLKVSGIPWTDEGVVYLKAKKIEMVPKPEDPDLEPRKIEDELAELEAQEPPPEVVFSMPLAGEKSVPLNSEFRIQFSKDMDNASFDRNVDLIYSDDGPDEHSFPDMQISYDRPSRSLVVIPGKVLEPGKEIRLILYRGITDNEGRPLVPDPDASEVPEAAVILSFFTEGPV
ncbi:MAG: Ig-like domain-containing protein, partial [Vicinamibacteria bacterium]